MTNKLTLAFIFFVAHTAVLAQHVQDTIQSDTTTVTIYEEHSDVANFRRRERFNYFRWSEIEEKSMVKLGVNSFLGKYIGIACFLGYEHKLSPSFSAGGIVKYIIPFHSLSNDKHYLLRVAPYLRYFMHQKKNIEKGRSGNNLLSNYFELRFESVSWFANRDMAVASWGLQRRIGKFTYLDAGFGVAFNQTRVEPSIRIEFGFGLSKRNFRTKRTSGN